jgi:dTDP-4-dehydrorhamnose reductase
MLRLASQKNELRVVADQWGSPTPADLIADITAQALMMIRRGLEVEGVFNLAPDGETCWHHYAQTIFEHLSRLKACKTPEVYPVESKDYPTSAQRPANSRLCTDKIKNLFGFSLPEWEIPLRRIIEEAV